MATNQSIAVFTRVSTCSMAMGMFVLILSACGDSVTNNEGITQIIQEKTTVVSDVSELPDCTAENEGEQAFVKGETASRICIDGSWQALLSATIDKQGELKCSTESLADGSGVKILCNGDSIGVLLNGANGADGMNGANGKSAYELAKAGGYTGTETEWLESLKGADGMNGANGKSAYELAKAGGYTGTETEWLESLKGADGAKGVDGKNGANGKSAYDIAKAGGYRGTEAQWLESLKGADGTNGKSAYEIAKVNGYIGTETEWLESLKGIDGNSCFLDNECGSLFLTCGNDKYLLGFGSTYMMLTDKRDQKSYRTVLIGEQCWMAENLNYDDSLSYPVLKKGSGCYEDLAENCEKYGRLYSWPTAMDSAGFFSANGKECGYNIDCSPTYPVRGICPEGWHLPTKAEFETLISIVGGKDNAGNALGTWGTNSYGFNALELDLYSGLQYDARAGFWSASYYRFLVLQENAAFVGNTLASNYQISVRCLQD